MEAPDALHAEIQRLFRQVTRETRDAGPELALTPTQRVALAEVADAGPLRLHALADRVGTTAPTASRAVDALVSAGLVRRVEDPSDRRAVQIAVTRRGRAHVDARRAQAARILAPAFAGLEEHERDELVRLLARLNEALAAGGTV